MLGKKEKKDRQRFGVKQEEEEEEDTRQCMCMINMWEKICAYARASMTHENRSISIVVFTVIPQNLAVTAVGLYSTVVTASSCPEVLQGTYITSIQWNPHGLCRLVQPQSMPAQLNWLEFYWLSCTTENAFKGNFTEIILFIESNFAFQQRNLHTVDNMFCELYKIQGIQNLKVPL